MLFIVFNTSKFSASIDRSSHWRCCVKKDVLRSSKKFTENTCARISFFARDSGTGVFPWILRNFEEHLFYTTPPNDYLFVKLIEVQAWTGWKCPACDHYWIRLRCAVSILYCLFKGGLLEGPVLNSADNAYLNIANMTIFFSS